MVLTFSNVLAFAAWFSTPSSSHNELNQFIKAGTFLLSSSGGMGTFVENFLINISSDVHDAKKPLSLFPSASKESERSRLTVFSSLLLLKHREKRFLNSSSFSTWIALLLTIYNVLS